MNVNTCEPKNATAYLQGEFTSQQEQEYTRHLDSCESCREHLESIAAEDSMWTDVRELLVSQSTNEEHLETEDSDQSRLPISIQQVVSVFQPTDDPKSMGRIDNFEVIGVIGSGAMGVVLKAKDVSLDRIVALKVMNPSLAASGTARSRFEREAKAAAAIHHHNVVSIHGVQTSVDLPYLVMPYLKGGSLQQRAENQGPFTLSEILRIGSQISAGLAEAHRQGVVHRDIKPSNIMLDSGVETAVITDFGLARIVDDATMTRTGVISGTPEFMSPEQARGDAIDGKSDIFSLGSLLYMLCTGYPPFRAQTSFGVLRKITDETPKSIRQLNPEIPAWLCEIIVGLLRKQPADRPTAAEAQLTLEACLAHVYQPDQVPLPDDICRPVSKPFPVRPVVLGVFAMIATLLFLAVVFFPGGDGKPFKLMPNKISTANESKSGSNSSETSEDDNYDEAFRSAFGDPLKVMPPKLAASGEKKKETSEAAEKVELGTYRKEFQLAFADPSTPGKLEVDIFRGSIKVAGHASNMVVVRLSIPNGQPKKSKDSQGLEPVRAQNFDFDIEGNGNYIKVDSNSRRFITNIEVLVPFNANLKLDSYQEGKLTVRGVTGDINARSQYSDIELVDACGHVDLYSNQGNLKASFKSIERLDGSEFDSYNGTIDLSFPADLHATVRYENTGGRVLTDFDLNTSEGSLKVTSPKDGDYKIAFDKYVTGTINGGGAVITIETTNGDIKLRRRK